MKIITDHKWRDFKYRNEVPARVLRDYLNWTTDENDPDGYLCYRGRWYHVGEFERAHDPPWAGTLAETFFSAILIEVSNDGERYRIGRCYALRDRAQAVKK